jgi:hypothetical protein
MSLRSLRHPFAAVKAAFRDATETALPPSASLVASCKMSNSNPVQHAAIKIQTSIAPTAGGNTIPDGWMFPQPYRGRKGFLPRPGSFAFSEPNCRGGHGTEARQQIHQAALQRERMRRRGWRSKGEQLTTSS